MRLFPPASANNNYAVIPSAEAVPAPGQPGYEFENLVVNTSWVSSEFHESKEGASYVKVFDNGGFADGMPIVYQKAVNPLIANAAHMSVEKLPAGARVAALDTPVVTDPLINSWPWPNSRGSVIKLNRAVGQNAGEFETLPERIYFTTYDKSSHAAVVYASAPYLRLQGRSVSGTITTAAGSNLAYIANGTTLDGQLRPEYVGMPVFGAGIPQGASIASITTSAAANIPFIGMNLPALPVNLVPTIDGAPVILDTNRIQIPTWRSVAQGDTDLTFASTANLNKSMLLTSVYPSSSTSLESGNLTFAGNGLPRVAYLTETPDSATKVGALNAGVTNSITSSAVKLSAFFEPIQLKVASIEGQVLKLVANSNLSGVVAGMQVFGPSLMFKRQGDVSTSVTRVAAVDLFNGTITLDQQPEFPMSNLAEKLFFVDRSEFLLPNVLTTAGSAGAVSSDYRGLETLGAVLRENTASTDASLAKIWGGVKVKSVAGNGTNFDMELPAKLSSGGVRVLVNLSGDFDSSKNRSFVVLTAGTTQLNSRILKLGNAPTTSLASLVGKPIYGTGIPDGAVVSLSGVNELTLSTEATQTATDQVLVVNPNNIIALDGATAAANSNEITITTPTDSDLSLGMTVFGLNIRPFTTIQKRVDGVGTKLTLSGTTTAVPSSEAGASSAFVATVPFITLTGAIIQPASNKVTIQAGQNIGLQNNMPIHGTGIPFSTRITEISPDGLTLTLSQNATVAAITTSTLVVNPEILTSPGLQLASGAFVADITPPLGKESTYSGADLVTAGLAAWYELGEWGRGVGGDGIPINTVFTGPVSASREPFTDLLTILQAVPAGSTDAGTVKFSLSQRATQTTAQAEFTLTYGRSTQVEIGTVTFGGSFMTVGNLNGLEVGMAVSGQGLPGGVRIRAIDASTNRLTLSNAATAGVTAPYSFRRTGSLVEASIPGMLSLDTTAHATDFSSIQTGAAVTVVGGTLRRTATRTVPGTGQNVSYDVDDTLVTNLKFFNMNAPTVTGVSSTTLTFSNALNTFYQQAINMVFQVNGVNYGPFDVGFGSNTATFVSSFANETFTLSAPALKSSTSAWLKFGDQSYGPFALTKNSLVAKWIGPRNLEVGMPVQGTGIPAGSVVMAVNTSAEDANKFNISLSAKATVGGTQKLTIAGGPLKAFARLDRDSWIKDSLEKICLE